MRKEHIIDFIGADRWKEFLEFMDGQTVGINKDGSTDYFDQDVSNFLRDPKYRFFD